jgi:hypothetical protein
MTTPASLPRLGVDIGRVIIHGDGPDTSFIGGTEDQAMRAPPMEGAFAALARLCQLFAGRVWLVSKCGKRIEERSRRWLGRHDFFGATGIPPGNLVFCRERSMKAPICRDLGIGWFVDDRVDVLVPMTGIVRHRFLFGSARSTVPGVVAVPTWNVAERAISATVQG